MRPLDPRLVREARATIWFIATVVVLTFLATASTIAIAFSLASFIVAIFVDGQNLESQIHWLGFAVAAALLRSAVGFVQEWAGFKASSSVKLRLRERALDKAQTVGDQRLREIGTGQLSLLLGPALESLDVYFARYLPQLVFTALVTPFFVVLVWIVDPTSAVALIFTIPLIPLFMVMIGLVTRDVQQEQLSSLERLNGHFYEILRGIQTLKIFGRTDRQRQTLGQVATEYRNRTMRVLRVSFLSGFALELAASLSVALIAVTIGIRLVNGEMDLLTGLFVLLIAPEAYLPLRNVGAQFHAAAEGVEVSGRVLDFLEEKSETSIGAEGFGSGITVLVVPSGAGKSTMLRAARKAGTSWMPQRSSLLSGTVRQNLAGFDSVDENALERAVKLARLDDVALDLTLDSDAKLSGGQIQRVALARTFYHALVNQSELVLLDEPTAQQDPDRQQAIAKSIRELAAEGYKFAIATHQEPLIALAERQVNLVGQD